MLLYIIILFSYTYFSTNHTRILYYTTAWYLSLYTHYLFWFIINKIP